MVRASPRGLICAVSKHWDAHRAEVFLTAVKGPRGASEHRELDEKYEGVEPGKTQSTQSATQTGAFFKSWRVRPLGGSGRWGAFRASGYQRLVRQGPLREAV